MMKVAVGLENNGTEYNSGRNNKNEEERDRWRRRQNKCRECERENTLTRLRVCSGVDENVIFAGIWS